MQAQLQHYLDKLAYESDAADLNAMLTQGEQVIVIDARSADAYALEHIPGAISLPHRTMSEQSTQHLDRNALIVTYCDGIGCNGSTKGALNMTRLGFRVKELIGGLDWWKRDGHPTAGEKGSQGNSQTHCSC